MFNSFQPSLWSKIRIFLLLLHLLLFLYCLYRLYCLNIEHRIEFIVGTFLYYGRYTILAEISINRAQCPIQKINFTFDKWFTVRLNMLLSMLWPICACVCWCVCVDVFCLHCTYSYRVIKGLHNVKRHFMALVCASVSGFNLNLGSHPRRRLALEGFSYYFFFEFIFVFIFECCGTNRLCRLCGWSPLGLGHFYIRAPCTRNYKHIFLLPNNGKKWKKMEATAKNGPNERLAAALPCFMWASMNIRYYVYTIYTCLLIQYRFMCNVLPLSL